MLVWGYGGAGATGNGVVVNIVDEPTAASITDVVDAQATGGGAVLAIRRDGSLRGWRSGSTAGPGPMFLRQPIHGLAGVTRGSSYLSPPAHGSEAVGRGVASTHGFRSLSEPDRCGRGQCRSSYKGTDDPVSRLRRDIRDAGCDTVSVAIKLAIYASLRDISRAHSLDWHLH